MIYHEDFYEKLVNYQRYSSLAYYKDLLIGCVSCRYEDDAESETPGTGQVVYIMSISVLKPYRRYKIGTQLLN